MAFVDDITIDICSGNGGDGVVRFASIRGKALAGPSGGNGGKGGDVYVRGVRDIGMLRSYRHTKKKVAEDGGAGMGDSMHGKDGTDLVLEVPIGSIINVSNLSDRNTTNAESIRSTHTTETLHTYEILSEGETIKVLSGGRGGLGNEHFKSSTNRSPRQSTKGASGLCATLHIELRLIANFGFVGTPNSGKTTLLNTLTRADAKVGNYAFTTLTPNLGVIYGKVIADIPGLIEGASQGKGLGFAFLRHIKRVNTLIFCISVERDNMKEEFMMVQNEMKTYDAVLPDKTTLVIFTKMDMLLNKKALKDIEEYFSSKSIKTIKVSALTGEGMDVLDAFIKNAE